MIMYPRVLCIIISGVADPLPLANDVSDGTKTPGMDVVPLCESVRRCKLYQKTF